MKKGLLICSGGISTTMIAKKLNECANGYIEFEAKGIMTDTSWLDYLEDYSILLVSPQIKHMYSKLEEDVQGQIKLIQIEPEFFNLNSITEFWEKNKENI
ncbi:PTS sugar transporter subunit IIB [Spiroplasma diminutum]|uniref:PTS EIIB type-3 domain-containing protein n=1 Tax=Spiroplasma diminutum CUAS-1 TaxID=1276221 RepID=S5LWS7_9MOLU|nr:hypothetical protein [Spiroplasma diminutum]AGR42214.1 hypothetical protein SDIMI_v3c05100 [Spiroplasma diminutum CUAS-1]